MAGSSIHFCAVPDDVFGSLLGTPASVSQMLRKKTKCVLLCACPHSWHLPTQLRAPGFLLALRLGDTYKRKGRVSWNSKWRYPAESHSACWFVIRTLKSKWYDVMQELHDRPIFPVVRNLKRRTCVISVKFLYSPDFSIQNTRETNISVAVVPENKRPTNEWPMNMLKTPGNIFRVTAPKGISGSVMKI